VFESSFAEGDGGQIRCKCDLGGRQYIPARTIQTIENFELLHSILYYLYTDNICFTTSFAEETTEEMPKCNAEDVYAIADRFQLNELKHKALTFLIETCCATNIVSRVFGEFAFQYEEVGRSYETIFLRLWNKIRETDDLSNFLLVLEESEDRGRAVIANRRCWELMKGLRSPC